MFFFSRFRVISPLRIIECLHLRIQFVIRISRTVPRIPVFIKLLLDCLAVKLRLRLRLKNSDHDGKLKLKCELCMENENKKYYILLLSNKVLVFFCAYFLSSLLYTCIIVCKLKHSAVMADHLFLHASMCMFAGRCELECG